jgi:hypothetical protein
VTTTHPLTFGIARLDELLGGFESGKLILFEGDISASSLSHLLCVRSQLPIGNGGLGSPVVWIDGGNAFDIYKITEFSKNFRLDAERVLKRIYISRAFTCHQMSALLLEKLWVTVDGLKSKLVMISDLPYLFLESDIPRTEVTEAFAPVVEALQNSPKRKEALILATSLYPSTRGENQVHDLMASKADIILSTMARRGGVEVGLEKHPLGKTKKILLGAEVFGTVPLDEFAKGVING